jgi:glycosyltransferase involved in cell wall biosynthesis
MSSHRPLVSVVTPCLNPGDRLRRCLESVAGQAYEPVEHIVVDGGSLDGTQALLRESHTRWVSEPDEGQADALNKGFALARGEVIGWLNADDELLPDAVATVVQTLAESPHAGWAYGNCEIVESNGHRHVRRAGYVGGAESFFHSNPIAQPGVFLTRAALKRAGGVNASFALAMDFDLWLRLVDCGFPGAYIPATLARFEITDSSKTGSVPWYEFLREEALALGQSGRPRAAADKLGQSAAWAAQSNGTIAPRALRKAVVDALKWSARHKLQLRAGRVDGAAALAAARLEPPGTWAAVRHILRPAAWRNPGFWKMLIKRSGIQPRA